MLSASRFLSRSRPRTQFGRPLVLSLCLLTVLIPNGQRLASNAVKNGQEARLVRVSEHGSWALLVRSRKAFAPRCFSERKAAKKVCRQTVVLSAPIHSDEAEA